MTSPAVPPVLQLAGGGSAVTRQFSYTDVHLRALARFAQPSVVVDRDLNTLHVFTGLEINAIPPARARALRAAPGLADLQQLLVVQRILRHNAADAKLHGGLGARGGCRQDQPAAGGQEMSSLHDR